MASRNRPAIRIQQIKISMNYQALCNQVINIAQQAGAFIRKEQTTFTTDKIEYKGPQNFVSYVDKGAEKIIVESLEKLIEGARFLTEEGTQATKKQNEKSPYCWIIDPLDGTTNFTHGFPPYCVSIALTENDNIVLGVIYEVTQQECFYAYEGGKAYLNGQEIHASERKTLEDSLIATGMSYNSSDRMEEFYKQFDYFMRYTHGARRIGSAAADLAYVAAGRVEAFSQFNLSPWDVAAGIIIAQKAGAIVSDYHGGTNMLFGKEIIATNPYIYKEYLSLVQETLK